jgi:hypothetical protein
VVIDGLALGVVEAGEEAHKLIVSRPLGGRRTCRAPLSVGLRSLWPVSFRHYRSGGTASRIFFPGVMR